MNFVSVCLEKRERPCSIWRAKDRPVEERKTTADRADFAAKERKEHREQARYFHAFLWVPLRLQYS